MNKILYIGAYKEYSGYGQACRGNVRALDAAGFDVKVLPCFRDSGIKLPKKYKYSKDWQPDKVVYHMTPIHFQKFYNPEFPGVIYTTFEANLFPCKKAQSPEDWVSIMEKIGEVLVPSEYNKEALLESGYTGKVNIIPHPIDVTEFDNGYQRNFKQLILDRTPHGIFDEQPYIFYSIAQWSERKNIDGLLYAFISEFGQDDNVCLILKTYVADKIGFFEILARVEEIRKDLNLPKVENIYLITQHLSLEEIVGLHCLADCYVSPHKSEGAGIPIMEAMAAENPVIVTGYTGNMEFCRKDNANLLEAQKEPVKKQNIFIDWRLQYTGKMEWYNPDISQLKRLMRKLYKYRPRNIEGRKDMIEKFSFEEIGRKFKEVL